MLFEIESEKMPFFSAYTYAFQHDNEISLEAKGLLAILISFPANWKIYMRDIAKRTSTGRNTLRKAVRELVEHRYLVQKRIQDERGRFRGWSYRVFQLPQGEKEENGNRKAVLPTSVIPSDGFTDIGETVDVKYIQDDNINKDKYIQQQQISAVVELEKFGVTKAGIKQITAAFDESTILRLITYAKKNKLGPAWLVAAAKDKSKLPPPGLLEAEVAASTSYKIPDPEPVFDEEEYERAKQRFFAHLNRNNQN